MGVVFFFFFFSGKKMGDRRNLSIRGCVVCVCGGYNGNKEKTRRGSMFTLLLMYSDLKLNFHQMCFSDPRRTLHSSNDVESCTLTLKSFILYAC